MFITLGLSFSGFGNVQRDAIQPLRSAISCAGTQAPAGQLPPPLTALPAHAALKLVAVAQARQVFLQVLAGDGQIVWVYGVAPQHIGVFLHLFQRVAHEFGPTGVDQCMVGLVVPLPGAGTGAGNDVVQPLPLYVQHLVRPFVVGDIAADGDIALYSVIAEVGCYDGVHPIERAVLGAVADLAAPDVSA